MLAVVFEPIDFLRENADALLDGLVRTVVLSAIAMPGSLLIGSVLGAARAHRIPVVSQVAAVYVEVIRNTPILIQIFMIYFGLTQIGLRLTDFTVAWLAVMVWGGAFNTENFRAGFEAVPFRYREAGLALGFSRIRTFLNITLPIGGRIALPSSINTYIAVLKNTALLYVISYPELITALLYVISYPELTKTVYDINAATLQTLESFMVLAVVYLTLVWSLSGLIRMVEGRLALPESA